MPDWIRYVLIIALVVAVILALSYLGTTQGAHMIHPVNNHM
jgi:hypothetical protein